ncbi:MAG: hypothetical protein M5U19_22355 [Microthrixaceae bacterium]|nr:hypothetical protein [Microthrixaceae bacterium]
MALYGIPLTGFHRREDPWMKQTSGIPTFDEFIEGGLEVGDNVVWLAEQRGDLVPVLDAFLAPPAGEATPGTPVRRTICLGAPPDCGHPADPDVELVVHTLADGRGSGQPGSDQPGSDQAGSTKPRWRISSR